MTTATDWPVGLAKVPYEEYHRKILGVVSKTALDHVDRSPAHYKTWVEMPEGEPTPALLFGQAFHCALLEPDEFAKAFTAEPDFGDCRYGANKARRDQWRLENAGKIQISPASMEAIAGMVASVRAHPMGGRMIRDGTPELTARWIDEQTGLRCKCRVDYYVPSLEMVVDAKSTDDASEDEWNRSVAKYLYHVQDAIYRAGMSAAGHPIRHFILLAVEKSPPYAVAAYELDADAIGKGYSRARHNIARLAESVRTNRWPAYSDSIRTLQLPPWA